MTDECHPNADRAALLRALAEAHRDHLEADARIRTKVRELRDAGASFELIGRTLTISATEAWERYGSSRGTIDLTTNAARHLVR